VLMWRESEVVVPMDATLSAHARAVLNKSATTGR